MTEEEVAKQAVDPDYAALAAFRLALRRFAAFSETEAKAAGLTPRQHQALLTVKGLTPAGSHGIGVREIADHLLIRHNSAVELVDRLVEAGLATRQADPSDGRRILVSLTSRSELLLQRLSAAHMRELRTIRPALLALLQTF
ncbi:MAG TPA: MarR family transcriptional regulator [Rhodopila sp.]|jgi:DNA-binding MarR family transcriptional regulator